MQDDDENDKPISTKILKKEFGVYLIEYYYPEDTYGRHALIYLQDETPKGELIAQCYCDPIQSVYHGVERQISTVHVFTDVEKAIEFYIDKAENELKKAFEKSFGKTVDDD